MSGSRWAYNKQRQYGDAQNGDPLQDFSGAGVRLSEIRRKIHYRLLIDPLMVGRIRALIVMMLIRSYARHMVMAAVNIDVLMFTAGDVSMRMTQGCQQEADTRNEAEYAHQGGHRGRV
jgi:hypothetical protein